MKMNCPNCNKTIALKQAVKAGEEASCKHCRYSFKLKESHIQTEKKPIHKLSPKVKASSSSTSDSKEIFEDLKFPQEFVNALPQDQISGFQIFKYDDEIKLIFNWSQQSNSFVLMILIFVSVQVITHSFEIIMTIGFSSFFDFFWNLGISVFFGFVAYLALAGFINRTIITANPRQLKLSHSPLPWFEKQIYAASEIEKVYIRLEKKSNDSDRVIDADASYVYHLCIRNSQGQELMVFKKLNGEVLAPKIATEIMSYLKP
jgi:DNA-directed RNA polymerase subunit M/transcription elongation factor TFIIS